MHKTMFDQTIHIDLTLPRSWNQCSPEQLETIAACIMKHTAMADRYHPFDWMDVKSELFFLLTETEIIRIETAEDDPDDTTYICRHLQKKKFFKSHFSIFNLRPWQVHYWIETQLKWLDDEKSTLIFFPYKKLIFTRHWQWRWPFLKKTCHAPAELLQNFTWQQYRHLQEYMSMYIDQQNALIKLISRRHTPEQAAEQQAALKSTRNEFLYILFASSQQSDRFQADALSIKKQVTRISEIQWQVILLWWSGFMHYLKEHYPRCFKTSDKGKRNKRPPNPLELYTSIIATMQKYIGIDEEKVNNQTFHIILEQLERIAKENEEIEKMNRRHKIK